ncbi:MAG: hypothetical protein U0W65_04570 [Bacteroidia bacterium]|nr:hypothetical protein [Bacteroidia bacterium]
MKILNIFKKEKKIANSISIQNLNKNQLAKVVGGDGETSDLSKGTGRTVGAGQVIEIIK